MEYRYITKLVTASGNREVEVKVEGNVQIKASRNVPEAVMEASRVLYQKARPRPLPFLLRHRHSQRPVVSHRLPLQIIPRRPKRRRQARLRIFLLHQTLDPSLRLLPSALPRRRRLRRRRYVLRLRRETGRIDRRRYRRRRRCEVDGAAEPVQEPASDLRSEEELDVSGVLLRAGRTSTRCEVQVPRHHRRNDFSLLGVFHDAQGGRERRRRTRPRFVVFRRRGKKIMSGLCNSFRC